MKVLKAVKPTAEQLLVINDIHPGVTLIRGAAGSGKTSTALLRLRFLLGYWLGRVQDGFAPAPVRVLVLTFNRTLRGYIAELAHDQISDTDAEIEINTFGRWSTELTGASNLLEDDDRHRILKKEGDGIPLDPDFLCDEIEYVLGRFRTEQIDDYVTTRRSGRGNSPRVDATLRKRLITEVISPYDALKSRQDTVDWNDLAVRLSDHQLTGPYHIIIVDETQDFSANQMRAVLNLAAEDATITLIMDAAQRIYPRGFSWAEVDLKIDASNSYTLKANHRNTKQIAAFCRSLLAELDISDDGTLPSFTGLTKEGPHPVLIPGRFDRQMDYVIEKLKSVHAKEQSAAILHARGGGWFNWVRRRLRSAAIPFVELTRERDWPTGEEEVALSTMASAKGLEFDHVFIIGLNEELTPHGEEEGDSQLENYRRLVAMAAGRARETVMVVD